MKNKILIFDTGSGGKAFADFFVAKYPDYEVQTIIDTKNSPYGTKTDEEIIKLVDAVLGDHIGKFDVIVLACNTATAVAIDRLRELHPEQIFIGFEPMVKTVSKITKTGKIIVCATNATKRSARYQKLKSHFLDLKIIEPDCTDWATKIDQGVFNEVDVRKALQNIADADVIILGCTHYVAKKDLIKQVAGNTIQVIEPFDKVADYIVKILHQKHQN